MNIAEFASCILPGYHLVPSPHAASHRQVTAAFVFVLQEGAAATAVPAEAYAPLQNPQFAAPFRLKILHLNDLHGQIVRLTPHGRFPVLARLVWWLQQLRAEAERDPHSGVLFVSAGDELSGSLFGADGMAGHAVYRAYSAAGLDAAVLGNHDLDAGPQALAAALRQDASFPVLAANVQAPEALHQVLSPAAIVVLKGVRVGLIGVTTPAQKNAWPVVIGDPRPAVRQVVAALRPWCDALVVLSHLGLALGAETATVQVAGDMELARSLPPGALQGIIGGHTHQALNEEGMASANVVNGIPILQAGAFGRFVGEATITINGRAALSDARLRRLADLPLDEAFEQQVIGPWAAGAEAALRHQLGWVAEHPDFTPETVRNDFAAGESALANFITDGLVTRLRARGLAVDLALLDTTAVHDGLVVGRPLTLGDWYRVMPYADTVRLLRLSGRQMWHLLQDNARRIDLRHEPHVERGFVHFSAGVRYAVQMEEVRADLRASEICIGGAPLGTQWQREFVVALSSFVRGKARSWERDYGRTWGADGRALPLAGAEDTGLFLREEVLAVIRQQGGIRGKRDGRLQLAAEGKSERLDKGGRQVLLAR